MPKKGGKKKGQRCGAQKVGGGREQTSHRPFLRSAWQHGKGGVAVYGKGKKREVVASVRTRSPKEENLPAVTTGKEKKKTSSVSWLMDLVR